ncbi:PepSY-associated TM helix domain-containing protein [uncultured Arenimonas sp.]|uniref:PepSY-associated TM helix domain-containing protein n=1 Tax=uncultured Arenimonas sp. TaxID=546226 RepID=UPI0030D7BA07
MKDTLSRSMAWLHTWSGLVVGWLLFVIFVGGTIACFDKELDNWMQPWLHETVLPEQPRFDAAIARTAEQHPVAHSWYVLNGNERNRGTGNFAFFDDGSHWHETLHPVTGEPLPDVAGGDFFFELHYNLHAGNPGMYLVGLAGMMMLVALVAGIIIHKRIFRDFFTFRPRAGGQRAWLDGHNLTGVLGLPFHLMIAYTGVAIFMFSYVTAGVDTAYEGDVFHYFDVASDAYERPELGRPLERLHSLDALVADARQRLGQPVTWASVHHPDDASAIISFGGDHSRRVAWNFDQVHYDAADGRFLHHSRPDSAGYGTYTFLGGLHMAQFGGSTLRWLYFLLGLAGCVMLASGMQVWVAKRRREAGVGHALVRALNAGVVAGMPLAVAAMAVANRLLPWDLADRRAAEITLFCIAWLLAAGWGAWRDRRGRGWRDLYVGTAVLLLLVPVVNLVTTPASHLLATLPQGEWALAAVDLTALALGLAFAWLARRQHRCLALPDVAAATGTQEASA